MNKQYVDTKMLKKEQTYLMGEIKPRGFTVSQ